MEIDAPSHAVAVWLEGDNIMVRFPDRQLVTMTSLAQLMITLKHREDATKKRRPMTVGTRAAPVQYDLDAIAEALARPANGTKSWDELAKEAGERLRTKHERERARHLRNDAKRMARKEAEALLSLVEL